MNKKYGKLDEGVLIFAPINLVVDDMQIINAEESDYISAGFLPIQYTIKPDDNEWQAVYTEVDGVILQSWVYEGRIHDHSNLPLLEGVTAKSLSGVPAVHILPTDAKDGDMCLYSPMNIMESGKRIYFDWQEFAKPVEEYYEIGGYAQYYDDSSYEANGDAPFDFYSTRGAGTAVFQININTPDYFETYNVSFDENGSLMEGLYSKKNSDDTSEETYYTNIDELPRYIDVPVYDYFEEGWNQEAPVPFFYAPYRLMAYRAGEWQSAEELFGTDCTAAEKVRIPEQDPPETSLRPNVFYDFGKRISVYIPKLIEGDPDKHNEYMFSFISGETATELTLPSNIVWGNDNEIVIEPGKRYEISIVNNIALWTCATVEAVTDE